MFHSGILGGPLVAVDICAMNAVLTCTLIQGWREVVVLEGFFGWAVLCDSQSFVSQAITECGGSVAFDTGSCGCCSWLESM